MAARRSRPAELRQGVEDNLRSLRVERMDLVNLRAARRRRRAAAIPLAEQLGELEDLREEGKLDLIGVSQRDPRGPSGASSWPTSARSRTRYSILDRSHEPLLDLPRARDRVRAVLPARLGVHRRAGASSPRTRRSPRSPASTARRRRRSRWPGCWPATSGSCSSRGRRRSRTSRRTWRGRRRARRGRPGGARGRCRRPEPRRALDDHSTGRGRRGEPAASGVVIGRAERL